MLRLVSSVTATFIGATQDRNADSLDGATALAHVAAAESYCRPVGMAAWLAGVVVHGKNLKGGEDAARLGAVRYMAVSCCCCYRLGTVNGPHKEGGGAATSPGPCQLR